MSWFNSKARPKPGRARYAERCTDCFPSGPNRVRGRVQLSGLIEDSVVLVDGSTVASESGAFMFRPGAYDLEVRAPGRKSYRGQVEVDAGSDQMLNIELTKNRSLGPYILGGSSLALAGVAGVIGVSVIGQANDWDEACPLGEACAAGFTRQRYLQAENEVSRGRVAATTMFSVAAAGLVGAVIWYCPRSRNGRNAMRALAPCTLVLLLGCTAELPNVDPLRFACEDDALFGGNTPCGSDGYCLEGLCAERLGCNLPSGTPGCTGPADPGIPIANTDPTRCDAVLGASSVAVRCQSGVHTVSSTRPRDFDRCDCAVDPAVPEAEQLLCATLAGLPGDGGYPLYVLPEGGPLPSAELGVADELDEARMCVRGCASDANCPASHTCRPAAVVNDNLLGGIDAQRQVLGVCYPNIVVPTSSTATVVQPDPDVCAKPQDCGEDNDVVTCSLRIFDVPDHPETPIGEAWSERRAFVGRCINRGTLLTEGTGCAESAASCASGVCFRGRCARICDPNEPPKAPAVVSACRDWLGAY